MKCWLVGALGVCLQNNKPWCSNWPQIKALPPNQSTNKLSISLCEQRSLTFPHRNPQNLKRVTPRLKEKQLQLIPRLLWRPTSTRFRGNTRVSDQGMQTCGHPPHKRLQADTWRRHFYIRAPRKQGERSPLVLLWRITYTGSVGASGPPVTASFLSQILTKKDAVGCASSSVNFRDTCRSPGYFCAPRCLLFRPPPHFPPQTAVCTAEWKITGFVLHRGRRRDEEGGRREGGREGGKGLAPDLYCSYAHARWGIRRLWSSACWLVWSHPLLQEWASRAPTWHLLLRKEIEEDAACWLAAPFTIASNGVITLSGRWRHSIVSVLQNFFWFEHSKKKKCGKITDELYEAERARAGVM